MASLSYSRWFNQGVFSLTNRIAVVVFGFLNFFFLVRLLPKEDIGVWVLFTSVTAIIETVRNGFIRNPFISMVVSAPLKERKTIITASLVLHCLLAFGLSIVLLLGAIPLSAFWTAPGLDELFFLYAANNIIFVPFLHFEYLQMARSNFRAILIPNVVRLAVTSLFIMTCYAVGHRFSLIDLAWVQIGATFLATVVGYFFVRGYPFGNGIVNRKLVKELFHFGKYTFGTNISSMFVKSTDSWMIGRMVSTAGVALYNPAVRLASLVEVPTLAIASVVFPKVPEKMRQRGKEGVRDIYTKSVSLILAAMLPVTAGLYVFAEEVVTMVFGEPYLDAAPILRVTLFYTLIIPFNRQFGTVMDSLKNPKINFYLLVMAAALNIIFNYFFLMAYGVIGSAYGTLLSYCIVFLFNQVILYRMYGINTWRVVEAIPEWYRLGWETVKKRIVNFAVQ